jgi:hypothetical protein
MKIVYTIFWEDPHPPLLLGLVVLEEEGIALMATDSAL